MRVRDFKWSTDVFLPAAFILVSIWGIAGGSSQVAFLAIALFAFQMLYVLARVERMLPHGSYAGLVSVRLYRWVSPANLIVVLLAGVSISTVALILLGLPLYLAILAGVGLTTGWLLVLAWVKIIRQRHRR